MHRNGSNPVDLNESLPKQTIVKFCQVKNSNKNNISTIYIDWECSKI